MEQFRNRARGLIGLIPPGQRVMAIAAAAVIAFASVLFLKWVSTPSYTLLYGGLDDTDLSEVIGGLDSQGIPYKIEGGGSRVLVPQEQVYTARAGLAEAGVAGQTAPPGYELLDQQGLATSDFQQRVDYQRALEGELAKTLTAMDGVSSATVRLAIPDQSPFDTAQVPVTASVLVDSGTVLSDEEVSTVVFLVSNAVQGLEPQDVTVADTAGDVLAAPGDVGGSGAAGGRSMDLTREYEAGLTADIQRLLNSVPGGAGSSVVVHAQLNFDETSVQSDSYDPESQVTLSESTSSETLDGSGSQGGATGATGATGSGGSTGSGVGYVNQQADRQFGVNHETTTTTQAPGAVEMLSVAVVMDDGSETGATVPDSGEVEELVTAALGLDSTRGDTIKVTQLPFPKAEEAAAGPGMTAMVPQAVGGLVMVVVAVALFLMSRGKGKAKGKKRADDDDEVWSDTEALPAAVVAAGLPSASQTGSRDVMDLVQRQPEEIAGLLRAWLADRRR